jgi:hypothetical protein
MQKITLTKVFRNDKDKEGKPLMTKAGKPYTKLALKCEEYGESWLSGFDSSKTSSWKEGDVVEVVVSSKISGDKTFFNFEVPKAEELLNKRIADLEVWKLQVTKALIDKGILGSSLQAPVSNTPAEMDEPEF